MGRWEQKNHAEEWAAIQAELSRLESPSPFAQELREYPFYPLQDLVYGEYEILLESEALTPTFFFPRTARKKIGGLLHDDFRGMHATFEPSLGTIVQFETGNELVDSHVYWHEQWHALGRSIVLTSEGKKYFQKVGYAFSFGWREGKIDRGMFLEEAVIDWLAAKSNVRFWAERGREITELESVEAAGKQKYSRTRHAFRNIIIPSGPEMERLIVQARFNPALVGRMIVAMNKMYGKGTAQEMLRLPMEPDQMLEFVFDRIQPELR